ncbi:MAG: cob(I)yrinic acid a,c-diamide adenosyltransferase [Chloroflexota bacterium]|nr:cob(I)yrinic acid a,c-diamide adenosyltransferase [Chloroflexia bacterium]MDQ3227543.1 cob(I)yrinic acid a,c-diamide adenosyltransferase [Chloroflexota bacterium]
MKFYTALGDDGTTDLLGARVAKDDPRVEALGALDEATSAIGLARALATEPRVGADFIETQRDLYRIMAELAFTAELRPASFTLGEDRVRWLEAETDGLAEGVDLPADFILPGESAPGAAIDLARTTVRRAERQAVALAHSGYQPNPAIISYLNRLSSLLFIAARVEDHAAGRAPRRAKKR